MSAKTKDDIVGEGMDRLDELLGQLDPVRVGQLMDLLQKDDIKVLEELQINRRDGNE